MGKVQWNDRFNIGVEIVDKAHQRLFSIVRKIIDLSEDETKQQHACREGIKYFKSYTVKHFVEEEAYMKSIHYGGYDMHKRLHDNLRDQVLPALERELEEQSYSAESVQHFLGICIGWLTGHIMIEDRAIAGRVSNKWVNNSQKAEVSLLKKAVITVIQEIFGMEPRIVSEHYGGEDFGKGVFFRFTYRSRKDEKFQVFLAYEERLLLYMLGGMLGRQLYKIDKTVIYAANQLSQLIVKRIGELFPIMDPYLLENENLTSYEQLLRAFDKEYPHYSLIYNTGENGYLAFCVKK